MKRARPKKSRKPKRRAKRRVVKRRRVARGQFYKLTWKQAKRLGYTQRQWSRLRYSSKVAAENRRRDKKKYGSASAAQKARREQREQNRAEYRSERVAWESAFRARHGREPTDVDDLVDFNYTWRERYARAAAGAARPSASRPATRDAGVPQDVRSRLAKLDALSGSPNVHEAKLARERAAEIRARHGIG